MNQIFARLSQEASPSLFKPEEYKAIIDVYAKKVDSNEWQDYAIFFKNDRTCFVVLDTDRFSQRAVRDIVASRDGNATITFSVEEMGYKVDKLNFRQALGKFKDGFQECSRHRISKRDLKIVK